MQKDPLWSRAYANEPIDLKLIFLVAVKTVWIPILAALIGAALFFGVYYLRYVHNRQYQAHYKLYVDYLKDENNIPIHYFNFATWIEFIQSDYFTEPMSEALAAKNLSFDVNKESLRPHLSANLLSDFFLLSATAKASTEEEALIIGQAMMERFKYLGENGEIFGITEIRTITQASGAKVEKDYQHSARAAALGAALFGFFGFLFWLLYYVWDNKIYSMKTFEKRYQIPCAGAFLTDGTTTRNAKETLQYLLKDYKNIAVVTLSGIDDSFDEYFKGFIVKYFSGNTGHLPFDDIRNYDCVLLTCPYAYSSLKLESFLSDLSKNDCHVACAYMINLPLWIDRLY